MEGLGDATLMGGMVAVALGLIEAIKAMARRRGSGDSASRDMAMGRLIEVAQEQLMVLRGLDQGLTAIRSDLRMAALEQGHLQKSVDALHGRLDPPTKKVTAVP